MDSIEGLSPAISIEQKTAAPEPALHRGHGHRDLRLPAPALRPRRPCRTARECGRPIAAQTVQQMVDQILALPEGAPVQVLAPRGPRPQGRVPQGCSRTCCSEGFVRVRVDGEVAGRWTTRSRPGQEEEAQHRGASWTGWWSSEALQTAAEPTRWRSRCSLPRGWSRSMRWRTRTRSDLLSEKLACPHCGVSACPELAAAHVLLQQPLRRLPATATGWASAMDFDPELVVPDPGPEPSRGAPSRRGPTGLHRMTWKMLQARCALEPRVRLTGPPWKELPAEGPRAGSSRGTGEKLECDFE